MRRRDFVRGFVVSSAIVLSGRSSLVALEPKPTLNVMAAVSLREAMEAVARDFETAHAVKIELSYGASGQLAAQIENGAPADVFISAADAQVNRLAERKLVDLGSRTIVAHNTLVLIVPAAATETISRFDELGSDRVKRLAIGEPKSVPAGMYAEQALKHLHLDESVAGKTVLGANVRQVLDYVSRGEVDAGIVYATDVRSAGKDVRIVAEAAADWHEPIKYPAVVIATTKQPELAKAFLAAMTSKAGRAALAKQGFTLPAPTTQPAK